jgi:hypothetical protein
MSYEAFDKQLIEAIKSCGNATFAALTAALESEAKEFSKKPGEEFRVIDRRLQALRKKKVIAPERLGRQVIWRLTSN